MPAVDDMLRDGLELIAEPADTAGVLDQVKARRRCRRQRRHTARTLLAAAVLVAGVAGGQRLLDDDRPTTVVADADRSGGRTVPAGMQAVAYRGVEVLVPAEWRINDQRCGTPLNDTAIVDDLKGAAACGHPQPPGLTVVRLLPIASAGYQHLVALATEPVTVDGVEGRRGRGIPTLRLPTGEGLREHHVLVIPALGVLVSVESDDAALADRILDSARLTEPPTPTTAPATTSLALTDVHWNQVAYPLDCGSVGANVLEVIYPTPAPGQTVAVVLVACDAGAGSPPRSLLVYDRADTATTPHLHQELARDDKRRLTADITAEGATLTVTGSTYSSPDVPRCCPDGAFTDTWTWTGSRYERT